MKAKKIKVYVWTWAPPKAPDEEIKAYAEFCKNMGIEGFMWSAGHNPKTYRRIGKIIKDIGLEFHAWIPTLIQHDNPAIKPEWYALNGLGESAYDKPPYVSRYQFVCPNRDEVFDFLAELYKSIAIVEEVDGIHLDYIRFPDVILAPGLWDKYDLIMDKEYPEYDYCYCAKCVADFMNITGINIKNVSDPSQIKEWKQFRYDLITDFVNRLSKLIRSKDKKITAAIFPGPRIAKKNVRQEWDKWEVDALYPMNYNDFYLQGTKWIGEMCKKAVKAVNDGIPVYSGLFICPNPENKASIIDPEYLGLLPEELKAAIKESITNGAAGICLFTPNRMTETHWKILYSAIHEGYSNN